MRAIGVEVEFEALGFRQTDSDSGAGNSRVYKSRLLRDEEARAACMAHLPILIAEFW